jgi:hypothetical protein
MKMKRSFILSFIVIGLLYSGIGVYSQPSSSVTITGQILAEVIPVFSASETSQMNFGRFSPGPQGGEIVLTPVGSISVMGSIFLGTGVHNPASFYVTGDVDASFSVSLPVNPVVLSHTSSSRTMLVDNWNSNPPPGIGTGTLKNGYQTVYVGATLKVGSLSDNPVGVYTGSYEITFDFN